ncbi:MAG: sodium-dependent transporter [Candidatus Thermoplasmatota archaeon]|nr:sodium-dependent transporter [Candidatus Thermoplasmatota archaeon]
MSSKGPKESGMFSSKWGLLMAALGAAIGTGNIWRFPREVANNGGGSFMIAYVIFLFTWSIPILLVEFSIGKKSRKGTMGSFAAFLGKEKMWMGAWMAWISTAIGFYYAVVMGWTIRYALGAMTGTISLTDTRGTWEGLLTSPLLMVLFQFLAIVLTAVLVYRGIKKGVERVNMVLIPIMFVLVIGSMIWALLQPGGFGGVAYLFTPKTKYLLSAKTWIAALAQCAWSCSAGMGMAITFGAYSKRKEDTTLNSFLTGLGDTAFSLLIGIMIFSTVFALSPTVDSAYAAVEEGGSGLTFIHIPKLFGGLGTFGFLLAFTFFLVMSFAALTSMISTYEAALKNFTDAGMDRKKAVRWLTVLLFIFGLPSALIVAEVSGHPLPVFLDHQDYVWGMGLVLSGAFIYYLVAKYGISRFREKVINSRYSDVKVGKWIEYILKYVIPLEVVLLGGWYIVQSLLADPLEEWWVSGPISLGLLAIQWAAALGVIWYLCRKLNVQMVDRDFDPDTSMDEDIIEEEAAERGEAIILESPQGV